MKTLMFLLFISSSCFSQTVIKTVRDPITLDKVQDWILDPSTALSNTYQKTPNGKVIQIGNRRWILTQVNFNAIKSVLITAVQDQIDTEKTNPTKAAKRQSNIDIAKAERRAAKLAERQAAQDEIDRVDSLPDDELP